MKAGKNQVKLLRLFLNLVMIMVYFLKAFYGTYMALENNSSQNNGSMPFVIIPYRVLGSGLSEVGCCPLESLHAW